MVVTTICVGGWTPKDLSKGDLFNEQCPPKLSTKQFPNPLQKGSLLKDVHIEIRMASSRKDPSKKCPHDNFQISKGFLKGNVSIMQPQATFNKSVP